MITINNKDDCCGCWACYNICPNRSITMSEDREGFRYPIIDSDSCIDCGLCEKVCPIINVSDENEVEQSALLLQHRDAEVLKESTSGGAFTAIGEWVISKRGVVFGAAFKSESFEVHHCHVDSVEELSIFRNSKYVQSLIGNTYMEAKKFLDDGRIVCFSGTPCQVEGLVAFLGCKYDNLLLIDVVCRAVPSPLLLRKYIQFKQQTIKGRFIKLYFREKYYGYKYSTFSLYNINSKYDFHSGVESNQYLRAFFSGVALRPSCYSCRFKKRYRVSDITIWDCFDVYRLSNEFDDDRGVTRCLVHSDSGMRVMHELERYAKTVEVDVGKALEGVREMNHSATTDPRRDSFFCDLNRLSEKECFERYFPINMRTRIERIVRKTMYSLGLYSVAKRAFKWLFPRFSTLKK